MENNSTAVRLRIYISSTDKIDSSLLFEQLVYQAREFGLAGATVHKGILGYGASSVIHSYKFWEVSEKLPVVVELIDDELKVSSFFQTIKPTLESMRYGCIVTSETVNVLYNKSGEKRFL